MFFLLRIAFWLTVVLILLPSGGSSQHGAQAKLGATEAVVAASAAVSDMTGFCERQPEACVVGAQTAAALGQRAQAGAKMVYDFITEHAARGDATSAPAEAASPAAPSSQNTLKAADVEPAWQGPPARASETVPMPRRDPRRKA